MALRGVGRGVRGLRRWALLAALGLAAGLAAACGGGAGPVDLLVTGGRVMDPETGFDAVADVAVRGGVVVAVGGGRPEAREVLDAAGLVWCSAFSPGTS